MSGLLRRRAVPEAQRLALRTQNAGDDDQRLTRHRQQFFDGPLSVADAHVREASADDEGGEPGDADRPRAHGTGLARGVERRTREGAGRRPQRRIDDAQAGRDLSDGHRLRVRGYIERGGRLVAPARDDLAVLDDDAADRHVAGGRAAFRLFDRHVHPALVLIRHRPRLALFMGGWSDAGLLLQNGDGAAPAAAAAVYLDGEAGHLEASRSRDRTEIRHLLDMAVLAIAPRVVGGKEGGGVATAQALDHRGNGNVEAPTVGPHHANPLIDEVQSSLARHPGMAPGPVRLVEEAITAGADQYDVERLEPMADPPEGGIDVAGRDQLVRVLGREVEHHAVAVAPLERDLVDRAGRPALGARPVVPGRIDVGAGVR